MFELIYNVDIVSEYFLKSFWIFYRSLKNVKSLNNKNFSIIYFVIIRFNKKKYKAFIILLVQFLANYMKILLFH